MKRWYEPNVATRAAISVTQSPKLVPTEPLPAEPESAASENQSGVSAPRPVRPASTQNQALSVLLSFYREVLAVDLAWLADLVRAKRPARLPVVQTHPQRTCP